MLLLCRYCPLKTTPRRSFPRPQSEAAWTCLPEFSVSNSLFKWGLHLAWKAQKGHPNSPTPCSPRSGPRAWSMCMWSPNNIQCVPSFPGHLPDRLWGSEGIPGIRQGQPFSPTPCLPHPDVHTGCRVGRKAGGKLQKKSYQKSGWDLGKENWLIALQG